jgi:hypothetical protein
MNAAARSIVSVRDRTRARHRSPRMPGSCREWIASSPSQVGDSLARAPKTRRRDLIPTMRPQPSPEAMAASGPAKRVNRGAGGPDVSVHAKPDLDLREVSAHIRIAEREVKTLLTVVARGGACLPVRFRGSDVRRERGVSAAGVGTAIHRARDPRGTVGPIQVEVDAAAEN